MSNTDQSSAPLSREAFVQAMESARQAAYRPNLLLMHPKQYRRMEFAMEMAHFRRAMPHFDEVLFPGLTRFLRWARRSRRRFLNWIGHDGGIG